MRSKSATKIWFELLKLSIEMGLPINRDFYERWGTEQEIKNLHFNTWWRTKGKALFEAASPKVSLAEKSESFLVIRVPLSLTATEAKKQVSALISKTRGTKRVTVKGDFAFDGDIRYQSLVAYLRYLRIELNPRHSNKTIEQKTELLRQEYRKFQRRLTKQKKTMARLGKKKQARKLSYRQQSSFNPKDEGRRRGFDAKKAGRWRLSAQILLLNVADGRFPGPDYYGSKVRGNYGYRIGGVLRERLKKLGIESLSNLKRPPELPV